MMPLLRSLGTGVLLLALAWPAPASAQEGSFAFEIRGGPVLPVGSFRSGEEEGWGKGKAGPAFGMGFTLPAPGPFGMFLGFGQRHFGCDAPACPAGADWVSTGFDVALRLVLGRDRIRPWFRGGLHTHVVEGRILESGSGASGIQSETGYGYEVGGGVLIALGRRTSLSPGIRYGFADVPFQERPDLALRYLVADLGLVLGF